MAKFNLGVHGSHNASIAISYGGDILEVVELERWVQIKNAAFFYYFPIENPLEILSEILSYFEFKYNAKEYDFAMVNSWPQEHNSHLKATNVVYVPHHLAHACNVMYQSDAKKSLIVSFDGGSDDGHFNIYLGDKPNTPVLIHQSQKDLCVPYAALGHYMNDIKKEPDIFKGNLTNAGKAMGLSSYGKRDDVFFDYVNKLYDKSDTNSVNKAHENWSEIFCGCNQTGDKAKDLAYANQYVFEKNFADIALPFIFKNLDRELQFAGGGAMNILNNTTYEAFVSPNADDRGIALGCLLSLLKPEQTVDSTYLGSDPYDDIPDKKEISVLEVSNMLSEGSILGLIQGRGEHGARSLGNRSILCLPQEGVKEKLNSEVKNREWFRPFAAVCREEDAHKYFKDYGKHRWMTHNVKVLDNKLPGITHIDGTCRLQTVTKEQNPFLWNILGIHPVILNTSFNIQGKPILNTYREALWMKENTGINEVITNKYILS
tara:strand:- start:294 stop:1757 length:1464 start_codon:yes stop_codon:yes gene_type:complete